MLSPTLQTTVELRPGAILCGKYELVRLCGQGGSGSVFEARHLEINKPVAIKVLPRSSTGDILVHREALAGAIQSRHVVQIFDIAEDEPYDVRLVVMELLYGASLSTILAKQPRLEEDEAVTVLRHTLTGLERAHERGIVHGDLTPGNLYCERTVDSERVVILDFGIAHTTTSTSGTKALGGTPLWMGPDAAFGRNLRWTADTWPLGLLAYFMLIGEPYLAVRSIKELAPLWLDEHRA
ncbi:MAG TPA: serine/threonine-protein kinase, partial [Polyangiaceae bacterium]|nr:serine/threonine-protein kinase [Polyangiaceae bacterium]